MAALPLLDGCGSGEFAPMTARGCADMSCSESVGILAWSASLLCGATKRTLGR